MANATHSDNQTQILTLVHLLSQESLYCYSLGANGGFIRSAVRYFERVVDKGQVLSGVQATDPDTVRSADSRLT